MLRLLFLVFLFHWPAAATMADSEAIEVVIVRSENKLLVRKNDKTLRTFKVAFGSGGRQPKMRSQNPTGSLSNQRYSQQR